MKFTDRLARAVSLTGATIRSLVKMALQSRPLVRPQAHAVEGKPLIVMGNGPSLATAMAQSPRALADNPSMAVNFAANSPQFFELRPDYYILADPHFFNPDGDPNVTRLFANIASVTWPMTLFVPAAQVDATRKLVGDNVAVASFNPVGITAPAPLERLAFSRGWAMPRPRNVLIPAIMVGLSLGYKTIYLAGADHSWMQTLRVNERNEVVSVQPHFYEDNDSEHERVSAVYRGVRLHDVLMSYYVAFSSYFAIRRYAESIGATIYNSTPGSYIDAFERRPLP